MRIKKYLAVSAVSLGSLVGGEASGQQTPSADFLRDCTYENGAWHHSSGLIIPDQRFLEAEPGEMLPYTGARDAGTSSLGSITSNAQEYVPEVWMVEDESRLKLSDYVDKSLLDKKESFKSDGGYVPDVWMVGNRDEPGRVSPDGESLQEELKNYNFEGEQVQWDWLKEETGDHSKISRKDVRPGIIARVWDTPGVPTGVVGVSALLGIFGLNELRKGRRSCDPNYFLKGE